MNNDCEHPADETTHERAESEKTTANDRRLYAVATEDWEAQIKGNSAKEYCHRQMPGEEFYHLLMKGELYLVKDSTKICVTCALRMEILTEDRLHWQHVKITPSKNPL